MSSTPPLGEQAAYDAIANLKAQQGREKEWSLETEKILENHKDHIVRIKSRTKVLTTQLNTYAAEEPKRMRAAVSDAYFKLETLESWTSTFDSLVRQDSKAAIARIAQLEDRVAEAERKIGEYATNLEERLRVYTKDLEEKLSLLEKASLPTSEFAKAVQEGKLDVAGLGQTIMVINKAVQDRQHRLTVNEQTTTMQLKTIKDELHGEVETVQEVVEAMGVNAQVHSSATDAAFNKLETEFDSLAAHMKSAHQAMVNEIQRPKTIPVGTIVGSPVQPTSTHYIGTPVPEVRAPPGTERTAPSAEGLPQASATSSGHAAQTRPAQDPWFAYNAAGGQSAANSGAQSHPWAARSSAQGVFDGANFDPQAKGINMWTKLFEAKEVQHMLRYDGRADMELWYRKTTDYLVSRAPDIMPLLTWAEKQSVAIQNEDLVKNSEIQAMHQRGLLVTRPDVLSHHLWGFLSANLTDHAWDKFGSCERQQGLEAWRKVVRDHVSKTPAERLELESAALNPKSCTSHADLEASILAWEKAVRKYHDSLPRGSPERLSEARQLSALMRLMPTDIQEKALWDKEEFGSVHELKEWANKKVRATRHLHPKGSGAKMKLVASLDEEDDDETRAEVTALGDDATEMEVAAVERRRAQRRVVRGRARPGGPAPSAQKFKGELTCPNCLEKGHAASACPKPKVPVSERKCFLCGKPGHSAWRCPSKQQAKPTKLLEGGSDEAAHICCVVDGFATPKKTAQIRQIGARALGPIPLSEFVTYNSFAALSQERRKGAPMGKASQGTSLTPQVRKPAPAVGTYRLSNWSEEPSQRVKVGARDTAVLTGPSECEHGRLGTRAERETRLPVLTQCSGAESTAVATAQTNEIVEREVEEKKKPDESAARGQPHVARHQPHANLDPRSRGRRPWMAFPRPLDIDGRRIWVASRVVPTGWSAATGLVQAAHRQRLCDLTLAGREVRRDRPTPCTAALPCPPPRSPSEGTADREPEEDDHGPLAAEPGRAARASSRPFGVRWQIDIDNLDILEPSRFGRSAARTSGR